MSIPVQNEIIKTNEESQARMWEGKGEIWGLSAWGYSSAWLDMGVVRERGGNMGSSFVKFLIRHWVTLSQIIAGVFAEEAHSFPPWRQLRVTS